MRASILTEWLNHDEYACGLPFNYSQFCRDSAKVMTRHIRSQVSTYDPSPSRGGLEGNAKSERCSGHTVSGLLGVSVARMDREFSARLHMNAEADPHMCGCFSKISSLGGAHWVMKISFDSSQTVCQSLVCSKELPP